MAKYGLDEVEIVAVAGSPTTNAYTFTVEAARRQIALLPDVIGSPDWLSVEEDGTCA